MHGENSELFNMQYLIYYYFRYPQWTTVYCLAS